MLKKYIFLLFFCMNIYSMMPPSDDTEAYRKWFRNASDEQINERVVKPFLNRQLMPPEKYQQLLDSKDQRAKEEAEMKRLIINARKQCIVDCGVGATIVATVTFGLLQVTGQL